MDKGIWKQIADLMDYENPLWVGIIFTIIIAFMTAFDVFTMYWFFVLPKLH